jgi:hypothetical protein
LCTTGAAAQPQTAKPPQAPDHQQRGAIVTDSVADSAPKPVRPLDAAGWWSRGQCKADSIPRPHPTAPPDDRRGVFDRRASVRRLRAATSAKMACAPFRGSTGFDEEAGRDEKGRAKRWGGRDLRARSRRLRPLWPLPRRCDGKGAERPRCAGRVGLPGDRFE